MCGIAGLVATEKFDCDIEKMLTPMANQLVHRGPDDRGHFLDLPLHIALSHQRLAVQDLSQAGHQPMQSSSGRFVIVFNGEIYNHNKLRQNLLGSAFKSNWLGHSDTETLLAGIETWG